MVAIKKSNAVGPEIQGYNVSNITDNNEFF